MGKRWMLGSALAIAAALCVTGLAADKPASTAMLGHAAPAFTLDDQNGKPVSLSDYKGKIVVLEWTNKDCPFVQRHMKAKTMIHLADKYKDQGVAWLAIDSSSTHNTQINRKTAADNGIPYPILNDAQGNVGKSYGAKTTPDMFIINKDGNVVYSGAIDDDEDGGKTGPVNYVSKALDEVLAGKSVSVPETKSYGCSVKYAK